MIEPTADCIEEYNGGRRRTIFIEVVPSTMRKSAEGAYGVSLSLGGITFVECLV